MRLACPLAGAGAALGGRERPNKSGSSAGRLGRDTEARETVARLLEVDPGLTISAWIAWSGQSMHESGSWLRVLMRGVSTGAKSIKNHRSKIDGLLGLTG